MRTSSPGFIKHTAMKVYAESASVSPRITRFDFNTRTRTLAVAQLKSYMSVEKQTIHVTNIVLQLWFVSRARSCSYARRSFLLLISARHHAYLWRSRGTNPHSINPYPTAFPYGNGMVLHFYQQQESSTTKTVHKVINKGLKAYV